MIDRSFFVSFISLLTSALFAVAAQLVYVGVMARVLEKDQFGALVIIQLFLQLTISTSERGMSADLLVSKVGSDKTSLAIKLVPLGLFASILTVMLAVSLALFERANPAIVTRGEWYWALAALPFIWCLVGEMKVRLQASRRLPLIAIVDSVGFIGLLLFITIFWFKRDLNLIYISWVFHAIISACIYLIVLKPRFAFFGLGGGTRHSINFAIDRSVSALPPLVDRPVIAELFSLKQVGVFDNALKLILYPGSRLIPLIAKIIEPLLVNANFGDRAEVSRSYELYSSLLIPMLVPYYAVMLVEPGWVVDLLLGAGWAEVNKLVQSFSIIGVLSTFSAFGGVFLFAAGRSAVVFGWAIVNLTVGLIYLLVAAYFRLNFDPSFILGFLATQVVLLLVYLRVLERLLGVRFGGLAVNVVVAFSICLVTLQCLRGLFHPLLIFFIMTTLTLTYIAVRIRQNAELTGSST
jgi:O-antigen/teichoic acid export membrane protein